MEQVRPNWPLSANLSEGVEIAGTPPEAVLKTGEVGLVRLGFWKDDRPPFTWAGWVRANSPSGDWPLGRVEWRHAGGLAMHLRMGATDGRPSLEYESQRRPGLATNRMRVELEGQERLQLDRWFHLACTSDGLLFRLFVNGKVVAEQTVPELLEGMFLANLRILSSPANKVGMVVEHDELALYDRALRPEEVTALASSRGVWRGAFERIERGEGIWQFGKAIALVLALLIVATLASWVRTNAAAFPMRLHRRQLWPVWTVLILGTMGSTAVALEFRRKLTQASQARFENEIQQIRHEVDTYWQMLAALLLRARDWLAVQEAPDQQKWSEWLVANHYPHDYSGVVGIGYAEQVLPAEIASHEGHWRLRHGNSYGVWPAVQQLWPLDELAGPARLPVVLHDRSDWPTWEGNRKMLGRDLLFQPVEDRRLWAEARRVGLAIARNEITPSALELLAPEEWFGRSIQGMRLYVPWTLRTKKAHSQALPLSDWRGLLFASVDLKQLTKARFEGVSPLVGFRMYASEGGGRTELLLDTSEILPASRARKPLFSKTVVIPLYHYPLEFDFWTTSAFDAGANRHMPALVGASGGALSILSAALLLAQIRGRDQEQRALAAERRANAGMVATHQERERLSRDLHDGSIQSLYALSLHLRRAEELIFDNAPQAKDQIATSLLLLEQAIAELRRFILSSGTGELGPHAIDTSLERLVAVLRASTTTEFGLKVDPRARDFPPAVTAQLLKVAREALSNALRHGNARRVDLALEPLTDAVIPARWRFVIEDDGRGFHPSGLQGAGHGLSNLNARALELHGSCRVESSPGKGTRVIFEFPSESLR